MDHQTDTTRGPKETKKTQGVYAALALVVFVAAVFVVFKVSSTNNQNSKAVPIATVRITKSGFQPATLSVKQGTRIIWTNADASLHQVASNPFPKDTGLPSLRSEILNNTQTYTYTANTTGSFGYHDQLNPTVNATLVVRKQ